MIRVLEKRQNAEKGHSKTGKTYIAGNRPARVVLAEYPADCHATEHETGHAEDTELADENHLDQFENTKSARLDLGEDIDDDRVQAERGGR